MGSILSRILGGLRTKKDVRVLILGLDGAGKTTILYRLKLGNVVTTIPTVGFNVETVKHRNITLQVWDLGGQTSIRPYWRCYYSNAAVIVFVVDSTDKSRLNTSKDELFEMLNEDELKDAAFLILANKQDLPGAITEAEIAEALDLASLVDRTWTVLRCCATTGQGMSQALDWIVEAVTKAQG